MQQDTEAMIRRLKRDALVMSNARNMIKKHKSITNAVLYRDLFGTGFRTATSNCIQIGLDPDSNATRYSEMCLSINSLASEL